MPGKWQGGASPRDRIGRGAPRRAARFQLDADPRAVKKGPDGVGKTSTLVALLAALVALGLIGFAAWMMYSDWSVATVS